jgi:hypothetical protein
MTKIRMTDVDHGRLYYLTEEHRKLVNEMRELSRELRECAEQVRKAVSFTTESLRTFSSGNRVN